MNPLRFNQHSTFRCSQGLGILAAIFAGAFSAFAQDQQKEPNAAVEKVGHYVFKPVEIKPSPDGENYEGRFSFINKDLFPVRLDGFDEPTDAKFEPRFVGFQILKNGEWKEIDVFYCGTGAQEYEMKPGKEYQFFTSLSDFKEQDAPLTGRIGVGEFWSEPFVLDWKKDRSAGKFAQATKENFAKVRTQFAKAGFQKESLEGDDFCHKLLELMMKEASAKHMAASFHPFVGKLDVIPRIGLNGAIRIDFRSDEVRGYNTEYTGWFSLDPSKFSPEWFRIATKRNVEVFEWGDGIKMELDAGANFDSPLFLSINYEPFNKTKPPSKEESERLFRRMLGVLDGCLK